MASHTTTASPTQSVTQRKASPQVTQPQDIGRPVAGRSPNQIATSEYVNMAAKPTRYPPVTALSPPATSLSPPSIAARSLAPNTAAVNKTELTAAAGRKREGQTTSPALSMTTARSRPNSPVPR